jgi:hypothetical protein
MTTEQEFAKWCSIYGMSAKTIQVLETNGIVSKPSLESATDEDLDHLAPHLPAVQLRCLKRAKANLPQLPAIASAPNISSDGVDGS